MFWRNAFLTNFNLEAPSSQQLTDRLDALPPDKKIDKKELLNKPVSQYRNSRTGNARRAVSQPDHDILEGLPIRRWHKKSVNVNTSSTEKADATNETPLSNGYPEREMPKDWLLLPEHCQAILLAARRGICVPRQADAEKEGAQTANRDFVDEDEKPGLLTRKWALYSKDFEPPEREYLAKRRKGLRSLYGGSTVPINTTGQMRKIKIRNVDSEGNSQIVEALVPEGQAIDAEIVEEEVTSPTLALAPGTKVEGVGIANAEGVLVPVEQLTPAAQRRRPPPPKRRNKGPGRGRKKKVAFASGANGSTTSATVQAPNGTAPSAVEGHETNGVHNGSVNHDGEESIMQDVGQDGEDGSEDGSEGEDGDDAQKEEGEISATPEANDIKDQSLLGPRPRGGDSDPQMDGLLESPNPPTAELPPADVTMLDQPEPLPKQETALDRASESARGTLTDSSSKSTTTTFTTTSIHHEENARVNSNSTSEDPTHAKSASHSLPSVEPTTHKASESSTLPQTDAMEITQTLEVTHSNLQPQNSLEDGSKGHKSNTATEPPPTQHLPPPNGALSTKDSPLLKSAQPSLDEVTKSTLADSNIRASQSSPSQSMAVKLPELVAPPSEIQPHHPQPTRSTGILPSLASKITANADTQEDQANSNTIPLESSPARIRHRTPNAPTPSPPTPIPISFDPHRRERLMESPRAPTMSPPTPARDLSSSPDLPLAGHRDLPTLTPHSVADISTRDSDPTSPASEGFATDLQGASKATATSAVETNPPTQIPSKDSKHGEQVAKFSDGEEDLLGSLEQSLG